MFIRTRDMVIFRMDPTKFPHFFTDQSFLKVVYDSSSSSSSSFIDTKIKYIGKYIVTMCPANIISAVTGNRSV